MKNLRNLLEAAYNNGRYNQQSALSIDSNQPQLVKININGQNLEYFSEDERICQFETIQESDARELFHRTKELFDEAGIKFALVFGSLLGAVREGKMIHGDGDIDICIWDEEKLRSNLISLYNNGLKVCRISEGIIYSFRINMKCYIDVYVMRKLKGINAILWGRSCIAICGWEMPKKFFTGWSEIEFFGEKCLCPENPERLLEFWYGSDWRIPQDKKGSYTIKSAYYFNWFCMKISNAMKFLVNKKYREKIFKRKRETGSFFSS